MLLRPLYRDLVAQKELFRIFFGPVKYMSISSLFRCALLLVCFSVVCSWYCNIITVFDLVIVYDFDSHSAYDYVRNAGWRSLLSDRQSSWSWSWSQHWTLLFSWECCGWVFVSDWFRPTASFCYLRLNVMYEFRKIKKVNGDFSSVIFFEFLHGANYVDTKIFQEIFEAESYILIIRFLFAYSL